MKLILSRLLFAISLAIMLPLLLFGTFIEVIIRGILQIIIWPIWWIITGKGNNHIMPNDLDDTFTNYFITKFYKIYDKFIHLP